jgi:hypothetical protein
MSNIKSQIMLAEVKKNIFNVVFLVFIILIIGLSIFVYNNYKSKLTTNVENNFYERNIALESSVEQGITFVSEMNSIANRYINKPISNTFYQEFVNDLNKHHTYFKEDNYHVLEQGSQLVNTEVITTIFGSNSIDSVRIDYVQSLLMVLKLQDFQIAAHENNDSFALSYAYIDAINMSSLTPNISPQLIIDQYDSIQDVKPFSYLEYDAQTMNDGYFWTEPYYDRAGNGMMVTCSVPLLKNNNYIGVISVDIVLNFLNQFTETNETFPGEFYIISNEGNIIASSEILYESEDDVLTFDEFYNVSHTKDDYIEYERELSNVKWTYLYMVSKKEVNQLVFSEMHIFINIMLLMILFFGFLYFYIHRNFIKQILMLI